MAAKGGIQKRPFEKQRLDEEGDDRDMFTVSVNQEQREWLDAARAALDLKSDGQTLKILAEAGKNVLFSTVGPRNLRYLTRDDRRGRLSEHMDLDRALRENVLRKRGKE